MKTCPYCGKEYPDDATVCAVDRYPLEPPPMVPPSAFRTPPSEPSALPISGPDSLVFPGYRWSQRDAWMFFAAMVVINMNWPMFIQLFAGFIALVSRSYYPIGQRLNMLSRRSLPFLFPYSSPWQGDPVGYNVTILGYAAVCMLAVAYIARTNSIASFCKAMGLDRKPTEYLWFGLIWAVVIQFIGFLIYSAGLTNAYPNFEFTETLQIPRWERLPYLFPLLCAAFWEEPVNRGFLFKAFRGSYSVRVSIVMVMAFTVYMHWQEYFHFGYSAVLLTAFTVVQCYLREKSASLWDCILSHLAFNLTGLFLAGVLL